MASSQPSACLTAFFRILGISVGGGESSTAAKALPYRRKDWLFSKAERSFFGVLQQAVDTLTPALSRPPQERGYLIFAKIRIGDLLWLPKGTEGRQSHWNRIQSKHVDFVICSRDEVRPLVLIELDDSSHQREDRQERGGFLDAACKAAGLPLLRVTCKHSKGPGYNLADLQNRIRSALAASSM